VDSLAYATVITFAGPDLRARRYGARRNQELPLLLHNLGIVIRFWQVIYRMRCILVY